MYYNPRDNTRQALRSRRNNGWIICGFLVFYMLSESLINNVFSFIGV